MATLIIQEFQLLVAQYQNLSWNTTHGQVSAQLTFTAGQASLHHVQVLPVYENIFGAADRVAGKAITQ
jgi:hypothetical protein